MSQTTKKDKNLDALSDATLDKLSVKVGKICNAAEIKANKILEKHGLKAKIVIAFLENPTEPK